MLTTAIRTKISNSRARSRTKRADYTNTMDPALSEGEGAGETLTPNGMPVGGGPCKAVCQPVCDHGK